MRTIIAATLIVIALSRCDGAIAHRTVDTLSTHMHAQVRSDFARVQAGILTHVLYTIANVIDNVGATIAQPDRRQ